MSETLEEIAERIMQGYSIALSVTGKRGLKDAILFALRNERERCARVAEVKAAEYGAESAKAEASPCAFPNLWTPRARAADAIAAAIRKGQ